ncbi:MAG: primosomal protein N' [Oscillospiraceae bacterium]|nr:primosomal protein N' [Oscillospiraceae bacterium]
MTAKIAVENTLYAFDRLFSYEIPKELSERVLPGVRVVVPFGRGNTKRVGLVFEISEITDETEEKIKPISAVIDEEPIVSEELLKLCIWLRENTFCTYFDAFRAIIPPGLSYSLKSRFSLAEGSDVGPLSDEDKKLIETLLKADSSVELYAERKSDVERLIKQGVIVREEIPKRRVGDENIAMVRLSEDYDETVKLSPKQKTAVGFVRENESASIREVCYACASTPAVVNRLIEKNVFERFEYSVFRTENGETASESPKDIVFSPKQQEIYNGILSLMNDEKPRCALLRGITGSGKTSIFIRLINEALEQGKTAMMLVPEISLTPQMVGKFKRLFGENIAVMHSSLSVGERADEYRRVKEGRARIVIGTRSAVFAPVKNLGIIVIDEEGEQSYKSENTPRYHARDVAKQRCFAQNALLLLASATPSLESYYNAKSGRYSLFELDERYNNAVLPDVSIIDMRNERQGGNMSDFSEPLVNALEENLRKGEQSIILLNRRGYRTSVRCAQCGKPVECPNCSLPLTYHKANDSLICHYCGFIKRPDKICGKCGGHFFSMKGEGTQLVEDTLSQLFPSARLLRMDADTTSGKAAFEKRFSAFANHEYDIMVGTQMIAKGLDFPDVTLVGVLKTDNLLYTADYKAYERTFSLITQVVGRAGRAAKKGRAIIQTFSPEHFVINLSARQNYPAFYEEEIKLREVVFCPPICDMAEFGFSAVSERAGHAAAKKFAKVLAEKARSYQGRVPVRILGPAPNVVGKINGRYHFILIVKCKNSPLLRKTVEETLKFAYGDKEFKDVRFYADIV